MTQLLVSQLINAPINAVWPWVSDITKHSQWSPKPYTVELISGENGAVGSKYRSSGWVPPAEKNHRNDVEITEVVPGSKIVFTAHDENGFFKNTFKLEPVSQGTQVTFQHDFPKMKGMGRILLPLLLPLVGKKDAMVRLGMLKAKAEGN
ncbi:MAG: SRPBCC family protein [Actinobacteria bacterium]|nr:SRPBCC family protein [Actinomycetota bacterium]